MPPCLASANLTVPGSGLTSPFLAVPPDGARKGAPADVATRILVADDHLAVREGVRAMLETDPDFEVVGEAADGVQAMSTALELRPDLIVLDNSMPKMTGLEVARSLHVELPDTRIVFLTLDPGIRDAALQSGATSVVLKDAPSSQLLDAIRRAAGHLTAPGM